MIKTKVTRKGQTVVPAAIRKEFGIDANSTLLWIRDGKKISVMPAPVDPIAALRGITRGKNFRRALLRSRKEDAGQG